jgi:hypothetical protein
MLLDGVTHIAWISKDAGRLGRFDERVFDAVIGPTRPHGPGETMTVIDMSNPGEAGPSSSWRSRHWLDGRP